MIPTRSFGPTPSGLTLRRVGPTAEPLSAKRDRQEQGLAGGSQHSEHHTGGPALGHIVCSQILHHARGLTSDFKTSDRRERETMPLSRGRSLPLPATRDPGFYQHGSSNSTTAASRRRSAVAAAAAAAAAVARGAVQQRARRFTCLSASTHQLRACSVRHHLAWICLEDCLPTSRTELLYRPTAVD